jgi:uncharacterized protein YecE (DUF72 family)
MRGSNPIFIGTSGWCYNSWNGKFYPENIKGSDRLKFYSEYFNTVEINSSFYHLPKPETFKGWATKTPDDFRFTVKASRYITHIKRFKDCSDAVKKLIDSASNLGDKLALFLFQMPANLKKNKERFVNFLEVLPKKYRYVFEFRDESWFIDGIYELLNNYRCGIVISSSPEFPFHEVVTGKICYIRLHGSSSLYRSKYSDSELQEFTGMLNKYQGKSILSFIYFNNDAQGHAVENAFTLKEMLSESM